MATKTNTLNLTKPAKEDFYNVEDFNDNFQKIDDFAGGYGYYTGNVDELKQPGTYVVATFSEGVSGAYPMEVGWWYTVVVAKTAAGSVVQTWILATELNDTIRIFTRHFTGELWTQYFESVNAKNAILKSDLKLKKAENGESVISKNHSDSADYGTEIIDVDGSGNKVKFTIKANNGLENVLGFSMNGGGYKRIYGEHNFFVESAEHPGCYYRTVNGEKEWLNPPMMNYVEYRTTRRINGKAVYVTYNYVDTLEASPRSSEVIAEYKHGESIRIVNFSGGFYYNNTFYPISGAAGVGFIEKVELLDDDNCITLYISHGETITKLTTVVEYIKN